MQETHGEADMPIIFGLYSKCLKSFLFILEAQISLSSSYNSKTNLNVRLMPVSSVTSLPAQTSSTTQASAAAPAEMKPLSSSSMKRVTVTETHHAMPSQVLRSTKISASSTEAVAEKTFSKQISQMSKASVASSASSKVDTLLLVVHGGMILVYYIWELIIF